MWGGFDVGGFFPYWFSGGRSLIGRREFVIDVLVRFVVGSVCLVWEFYRDLFDLGGSV